MVDTSRSPCISTTSGWPPSSSMMSVLTTACGSRPSWRAASPAPPWST
ncbi:Uncharacterised protein [Bordetella pertussis]|nr:Uncharacterised protein [Bordetella pertussis]